jgi:allantoinase
VADHDLVLRGGTVCHIDGCRTADVAVTDGLIAAIGSDLGDAREEVDARGLHVLPGGVDPHVHFNAPGREEWEGWASGTTALAAGGFTLCLDMPLNSLPVTTSPTAFDLKLAVASRSAQVDFGLLGGLVPGALHHLEALAKRGAAGFKAFLCDSGIPQFPPVDELTLAEGMRRCAALDAIVLVHAESQARLASPRGRGARAYAASRPPEAELEAIERALELAARTGCRLHVVHVSTAAGVRLVQGARRAGVDASCETCPHYLLLHEEDLERLGAPAKCAPPLRAPGEPERLWEVVLEGAVQIVASDHSPCPPELKSGDVVRAWGGIAGCQTTRQLLLAEGLRRGLGVEGLATLTATNAAERFRLPGKGRIEVGADADLALVDLGVVWRLEAAELRYRHRLSPFLGQRMRGRTVRTILRGRTVFADGQAMGVPAGRLVRPRRG